MGGSPNLPTHLSLLCGDTIHTPSWRANLDRPVPGIHGPSKVVLTLQGCDSQGRDATETQVLHPCLV